MSLLTLTTELEAVNIILGTIGEAPVNTLEGTVPNDVSIALSTLNEISRDVQKRGYWFNTERDYPLPRSSPSNEIPVPTNAVSVEISRWEYDDCDPIVRGTKLYDRKNHTYTFTKDVKAERIVFLLPFTELSEATRRYVTIKAARVFQTRVLGSDTLHAYTQQEEFSAWRDFLAESTETEDLNVFRNPQTAAILRRS